MTVSLSGEQQQALQSQPHTPLQLIDPRTNQAYALVPVEEQSAETDEQLGYDPVPAKRSVTVRVWCRRRGRGQPLPYPEDAD